MGSTPVSDVEMVLTESTHLNVVFIDGHLMNLGITSGKGEDYKDYNDVRS